MDRDWMPVTMKDSGKSQLFSIREVFAKADRISGIEGDLPIQQFALARLLIAVLYGSFVDITPPIWEALWNKGPRDSEITALIEEYCNMYADRFDLFDEQQPFYQVADLHTSKNEVTGLERLILDVPSGEPFFTTRMSQGLASLDAAEAARWLVTTQAFDVSGIKSGAVGDNRVKNGKGYAIGTGWTGQLGGFLLEGKNLWQTLMLNLVGERVFGKSDAISGWSDDKPIWEREQCTQSIAEGFNQDPKDAGYTTYFHGPATVLTWQSRRIRLFHDGETVTGVLVCNGDRLKPQNGNFYETMSSWRRSPSQEKTLKQPLVYMPRKHDPSRALWHRLPSLTTMYENESGHNNQIAEFKRPLSMEWLTTVGMDNKNIPIRLHAFGIEYGNQEAVVSSTVDDALDLDLMILTSQDQQLGEMLRESVNIADKCVMYLRYFGADIAYAAGTDTKQSWQDIAACRQLGDSAYSRLDSVFRSWLQAIHTNDQLVQQLDSWKRILRKVFLDIETQYLSVISEKAIVGRQVAVTDNKTKEKQMKYIDAAAADMKFRRSLNKLTQAYEEGDSHE
jgi:CRISPR system Cascade subunit CasA